MKTMKVPIKDTMSNTLRKSSEIFQTGNKTCRVSDRATGKGYEIYSRGLAGKKMLEDCYGLIGLSFGEKYL